MMAVLDFLLVVGGVLAASAVALGCGVGLFVWLAGGRPGPATEAWRPVDER